MAGRPTRERSVIRGIEALIFAIVLGSLVLGGLAGIALGRLMNWGMSP